MEEQKDIRWIQRYANYHKACGRLVEVTEADRFLDDLSELEVEGLVQRFEYTFELAWKVLQDILIYKGYEFMLGPNGTLKMAFDDGLIGDHEHDPGRSAGVPVHRQWCSLSGPDHPALLQEPAGR